MPVIPEMKKYHLDEIKAVDDTPYFYGAKGWKQDPEIACKWIGEILEPKDGQDSTLFLCKPVLEDKTIVVSLSVEEIELADTVDLDDIKDTDGLRISTQTSNRNVLESKYITAPGDYTFEFNQKGVFFPTKDMKSTTGITMPFVDYQQFYFLPGISLNGTQRVVISKVTIAPKKAFTPKPSNTRLAYKLSDDFVPEAIRQQKGMLRRFFIFYVPTITAGNTTKPDSNTKCVINNKIVRDGGRDVSHDLYMITKENDKCYFALSPEVKFVHSGTINYKNYLFKLEGIKENSINGYTQEGVYFRDTATGKLKVRISHYINGILRRESTVDTENYVYRPGQTTRMCGFYESTGSAMFNAFGGCQVYCAALTSYIGDKIYREGLYNSYLQTDKLPPAADRVIHDDGNTWNDLRLLNSETDGNWEEIKAPMVDILKAIDSSFLRGGVKV